MVLLDQILLQGDDSLLTQEIVKKRGVTESVDGGINLLGNAFDYNGPMLWMASLIRDSGVKADDILSAVDGVVERVRSAPVTQAELDRALVKFRARLYQDLGQFGGFGKANLLASLALFDDNPAQINMLESDLRRVTPALAQKVASEYLRKTNRTVLMIEAGAATAKSE